MPTLIALEPGEPIPLVATTAGTLPLAAADLGRHAPDRHIMMLDDHGVLVARASCWWARAPQLPGERVGVIGHYAAAEDPDGLTALDAACRVLEQAGCTLAVGPMDGSTWRRYRWVVERGPEPPFFLEPDNPESSPAQFLQAGFDILATYRSVVIEDLAAVDPRLEAAEARLGRNGVTIHPLDLAVAREQMRRIFRLSSAAFSRSYLYTSIAEDEFLEQNEQVLPFVDPELVLLAERDGVLVGYVFAIPDLLERARGASIGTLIIKTLAVAGGSAVAGLGSILVDRVQREAGRRGYRRAIHALMHDHNVSRNIGRYSARTIRRYALFSRRLGSTVA